jgi:hypothetical protein
MRELLGSCRRATTAETRFTWVSTDFVAERKLHFPIWEPYSGETRGFHAWNIARALEEELRFRSADETAKDTLAWYKSAEAAERKRLAGPKPEEESTALTAWHNL